MDKIFAKVTYLDKDKYQAARKQADDKFGSKNSYVKNLYTLKVYKQKGGRVKYQGEKPKSKTIKKQIDASVDLFDSIWDLVDEWEETEAETKDKKKVKLNKPFRTPGGPKKFAVYVKNEKGNIVLVRFGDPKMEIRRDDPERRKSFRARHGCDNPGPRTSAKYWSCKMWSSKPVSSIAEENIDDIDFDNLPSQEELYGEILPEADIIEISDDNESCDI